MVRARSGVVRRVKAAVERASQMTKRSRQANRKSTPTSAGLLLCFLASRPFFFVIIGGGAGMRPGGGSRGADATMAASGATAPSCSTAARRACRISGTSPSTFSSSSFSVWAACVWACQAAPASQQAQSLGLA
jgi:hypothetical protein